MGAAYHYLRIFNSWVESYEYKPNSSGEVENPVLTGVPFNDAYRYMDWLLTVPLLLIEIVFVMKLSDEETKKKATTLGVASGLMITNGYPGELIVEGDLSVRWFFWATASPTSSPSAALALLSTQSQMPSPRVARSVLCCLTNFCLKH